MLTTEDAPIWLKNELQRIEWAGINNARVCVWTHDEAPKWISSRLKREEWAEKKTENEISKMVYLIPCVCDKCKKRFVGVEYGNTIWDIAFKHILGFRRSSVCRSDAYILCADCNSALILAMREFESQWVQE